MKLIRRAKPISYRVSSATKEHTRVEGSVSWYGVSVIYDQARTKYMRSKINAVSNGISYPGTFRNS